MKNLEKTEEVEHPLTSCNFEDDCCNETDHCHTAVEVFGGSGETKFLVVHDGYLCEEDKSACWYYLNKLLR